LKVRRIAVVDPDHAGAPAVTRNLDELLLVVDLDQSVAAERFDPRTRKRRIVCFVQQRREQQDRVGSGTRLAWSI
jgi:hypothetical protein